MNWKQISTYLSRQQLAILFATFVFRFLERSDQTYRACCSSSRLKRYLVGFRRSPLAYYILGLKKDLGDSCGHLVVVCLLPMEDKNESNSEAMKQQMKHWPPIHANGNNIIKSQIQMPSPENYSQNARRIGRIRRCKIITLTTLMIKRCNIISIMT